jgi:hypothetical protein
MGKITEPSTGTVNRAFSRKRSLTATALLALAAGGYTLLHANQPCDQDDWNACVQLCSPQNVFACGVSDDGSTLICICC